jgi:hypothetical protein
VHETRALNSLEAEPRSYGSDTETELTTMGSGEKIVTEVGPTGSVDGVRAEWTSCLLGCVPDVTMSQWRHSVGRVALTAKARRSGCRVLPRRESDCWSLTRAYRVQIAS